MTSGDINSATNRFINTGSTPTTYDYAGNITTDTKFRGLKYEYDANGRQSAVKLLDDTSLQSAVYDCAGQRVQTTAGSVTRTMVYDVFGQDVADYLGSSGAMLERENIYRGGQLLATNETLTAGAPSGLAATPSSSSVALSWTAASGASKYRVERKAGGGSYDLLTTTTSTSTTDSGASTGSAYLYRVCAADSNNNCTSDYSNIALGAKLNFTTDATICAFSDSSCSPLTEMKVAHITELRTAINAVRSLASQSGGSWTHSTLTAQSSLIYADDVRDLRAALHYALSELNIQTSNYTDNTIVSYADNPLTATSVRAVHIRELRTRSTSGIGNSTSGGSSGGLHYVLSDVQGSTRAVMNNIGSSSAIVARHDYLPFGEELSSVIGLRSSQGYTATDLNRWKYGMTERDATSGLDHTWWRKYESFSGRWTSPDPYNGSASIASPQSFNRYTYTGNDPVNFIDPSGLACQLLWEGAIYYLQLCDPYDRYKFEGFSPKEGGGGGGGGGGGAVPGTGRRAYTQAQIRSAVDTCAQNLFGIKLVRFDPSAKGHNGSFTGETVDGHQIHGNSQAYIVNATTSYTIAQMTAKYGTPGYSTVGYEDLASPHRNFTASDRQKLPSEIAGVSAFVQTQIHELGNSLSDIAGVHFSSSPRKRDEDEGQAFQDCVRGELGRSPARR